MGACVRRANRQGGRGRSPGGPWSSPEATGEVPRTFGIPETAGAAARAAAGGGCRAGRLPGQLPGAIAGRPRGAATRGRDLQGPSRAPPRLPERFPEFLGFLIRPGRPPAGGGHQERPSGRDLQGPPRVQPQAGHDIPLFRHESASLRRQLRLFPKLDLARPNAQCAQIGQVRKSRRVGLRAQFPVGNHCATLVSANMSKRSICSVPPGMPVGRVGPRGEGRPTVMLNPYQSASDRYGLLHDGYKNVVGSRYRSVALFVALRAGCPTRFGSYNGVRGTPHPLTFGFVPSLRPPL